MILKTEKISQIILNPRTDHQYLNMEQCHSHRFNSFENYMLLYQDSYSKDSISYLFSEFLVIVVNER